MATQMLLEGQRSFLHRIFSFSSTFSKMIRQGVFPSLRSLVTWVCATYLRPHLTRGGCPGHHQMVSTIPGFLPIKCQQHLLHHKVTNKCLQTSSDVSWEQNQCWVRNMMSYTRHISLHSFLR